MAVEVESSEQLTILVKKLIDDIKLLRVGDVLLVPGGWQGQLHSSWVYHIIECTGENQYAFITCNTGQGLEYHPSNPKDSAKMLFKTCIRIEHVPVSRITNPALWTMLLAMWTKSPPSEYHRVEVLYDVLLPWIAGRRDDDEATDRFLIRALKETDNDPFAEWRSPQCSNTSATRGLLEALRYLMRRAGLSSPKLKQLTFALRHAFLTNAAKDFFKYFQSSLPPDLLMKARIQGFADGPPQPSAKTLKLPSVDQHILGMACSQLAAVSVKESESGRMTNDQLRNVKTMLDCVNEMVNCVPKESGTSNLPPVLAPDLVTAPQDFQGCHLLLQTDVDKYIGEPYKVTVPTLSDLLSIPPKVETAAQAVQAIIQCDSLCEELMSRAKITSTSSKLANHMQIIGLISYLFTEVLPIPLPLNAPPDQHCIWRNAGAGFLQEMQSICLERIHKLAMTYTTLWQSIERPSRSYDSERALVASCMLSIFDAVVRFQALHPLLISELMWEDGGYTVHTGVCRNNREYEEISNTMEFVNPSLTHTRSQVLAYLASLKKTCRNRIFEFRQPDKFEVRKYSSTVNFLRKMMERCGYQLIPRDHPMPPSEMEALMNWLFSDRTELAQDHPEFHMLR
ncbi:nxn protein, partial [Pelomyxa schiedti]